MVEIWPSQEKLDEFLGMVKPWLEQKGFEADIEVARSGPLTVGEQAAHLRVGRATATELIDRLEAKGLVERMRDERDRRRVFVWLTNEGRRRLAGLPDERRRDPFVEAVAALDVKTRRQIISGLSKLLQAAGSVTDKVEEKVS